ncbi:ABC transporter ATP-binding protein [Candidatus Bathyarchaeota archaeon]|nr:MAG: ABC transporter ATP-binding protein [Candidatus Bathyarchaeota archaeon]
MRSEPLIEVVDLARYYEMAGTVIKALDGVTLEFYRGEYVSIVGPSGSGKTTLFNLIGGLDRPTRGKVYVDGVDLAELDAYELAWLRCRKIGYIFQNFNLIGVLTALENVALPTVFAGLPWDEGVKRAEKLLRMVGLGDRLSHLPSELSAGQQQRVAIARAMVNDPDIILADEPTGNLDHETGRRIIGLLQRLNRERGVTIIAATHDVEMIRGSDRIVWLRDGRVERVEVR